MSQVKTSCRSCKNWHQIAPALDENALAFGECCSQEVREKRTGKVLAKPIYTNSQQGQDCIYYIKREEKI